MPQAAVLWLDLGRTKDDDAQMLASASGLGRPVGLTASVGIARGKFTALAAATHIDSGVRLIKRGNTTRRSCPAAVSLCPLRKKMPTARPDGIRTLGQFTALPLGRFGAVSATGRTWHMLAPDRTRRPVRP